MSLALKPYDYYNHTSSILNQRVEGKNIKIEPQPYYKLHND
jgi:hypothetical protein